MKFLYIPLQLGLGHALPLLRRELKSQTVLSVHVNHDCVVIEYTAEKDSINRDALVV